MTSRPEVPSGRIRLDDPPRLPAAEGVGGVASSALPMLGSLGSVVLVASLGGGSSEVRVVAAGLFLVTTVAYLALQLDRQRGQRRRRLTGARRAYLRHLAGVRAAVREAAAAQRHALCWLHPSPAALPAVAADGTRVGERGPEDPAFLQVRYGVCAQSLSVELAPPADLDADDADPVAVSAARRLLGAHRVQPGLPAAVDLRRFRRIALVGEPAAGRGVARALVCSAAAFHSPDHLAVAVLATDDTLEAWEWVKWLPHAQSDTRTDAVGPARLVRSSPGALADLLPATNHVLLVVDGPSSAHGVVPPDGCPGVTVVEVGAADEPPAAGVLRLELEAGQRGGSASAPTHRAGDPTVPVRAVRLRAEPVTARADLCDPATAEAVARRLLPRQRTTRSDAGPAAPADLPDLLAIDGVTAFDPAVGWRPRSPRDRLRVPVGTSSTGPVHLDLKESAQHGTGPHGLVVGATGSGKSEFLRTLVLGLALTHPPDQLNLVLVDFKGGATFAGMADLPHVSAVITNLAGELALVDRMHDALAGEMVRRQEALRTAGNLASVHDYEQARSGGAALPPLPSLLIVVDEFSELLAAKPGLTDLFVAIGRLGRSLGLHLLLASQRLEEGRLRGLDSHLSYRVGLRTFSAQESRTVLGVPDAYELPPTPGVGYLKPDPTTLTRFRAAYVSGPSGQPTVRRRPARPAPLVLPFAAREVRVPADGRATAGTAAPHPVAGGRPTVLDAAVDRMRGRGPAAHRIWLPPLDRSEPLDRLLPSARGPLLVPVGTLDRPREQRRDPLVLDLAGAGGHVAVVGGPRSGKSTLLRTMLAASALSGSPEQSRWFVLDLGGGGFGSLAGLPHVSGVAGRADRDVVRRIVAEVQAIADRREAGDPADGPAHVFLCVDGWSTLRAEHDDLEPALQQLAQRGLGLGIHLVASSARWSDFRAALRDQLGTRLELRLGDPADSEVDRRAAATVPADRPGRGLVPGPLHFLTALPPAAERLIAAARDAWPGLQAPPVRLLPTTVALDAVRQQAVDATGLLLGLDEARLAPVVLDPTTDPHLLVFGDGRSGRSALLRTYLHEVARTRTPDQAQVVVVDYRRALLGEVPDQHLLHYLTSADQARPALDELASYLRGRLPGPGTTPDQLRRRSWWSGAEVFVVVDDYDLVATPQGSPLAALQPLLAQAGDVGLHLAVARRSGGAARALFEPVIQTLRDLAAPGVLLSGSREEGPLIGTVRPTPAVPGRAQLVTRDRGAEVVQVAWSPESGE